MNVYTSKQIGFIDEIDRGPVLEIFVGVHRKRLIEMLIDQRFPVNTCPKPKRKTSPREHRSESQFFNMSIRI